MRNRQEDTKDLPKKMRYNIRFLVVVEEVVDLVRSEANAGKQ